MMSAARLAVYVKEILVLLAISAGYENYWARITGFESAAALVFYGALFALLLLLVFLTAYIQNAPVRYLLSAAIAVSFAFEDTYFQVMGESLTYSNYVMILNTFGFAGDALTQYASQVYASFGKGFLLFAGVAIEPRRRIFPSQALPLGAPIVGIAALALMLFFRGGYGATGLHGSYTVLAYSVLYGYEALSDSAGSRRAVEISRAATELPQDIVLIVDESVRGDYLDINSDYGVRSGLLGTVPGAEIINFGLGAAITNCSYNANITIRHGGTRKEYWRINTTMPSIWQYAKQAGYRTVYIDAQLTRRRMQNGMDTSGEFEFIDSFIQFDDAPVVQRDILAGHAIVDITLNDSSDFVVVNKVGAHFPVHDKYPDEFLVYTPALSRGGYRDVAYSRHRDGFNGSREDWVLYRNSYRNTLLWNVGEFFFTIFAGARLDNAVVFYTSDHGQELHENGEEGTYTHCRQQNATSEEGVVPMVLIKGARVTAYDFRRNLAENFNGTSHYNLFPTLLMLMGYDPEAILATYGTTLADVTNDPLTFNIRFDARLGAQPVWKKIEVVNLQRPPEGLGAGAP